MSQPFFSIVIPTYNRAHTVGRALRSCVEQTIDDFEIIVVDDDKSNDDIAAALVPFQALPVRLVEKHKGKAAAARNAGIRLARGRYVAFLDADDEYLPRKLELCRNALLQEPDLLLYSQNYVDRGVGRYWIKPARGLGTDENIFDYLFRDKGWIHPSSVVVRTELANQYPFNEHISFGDDMQFAAEIWLAGTKIRMLDVPLTIYPDLYDPTRLSQSPVFVAGSAPEHVSFMDWVESQRSQMSEEAYLAYCAYFRSRFVARADRAEALKDIWTAYHRGIISYRKCLGQIMQTFTPNIYRHSADTVARCFGLSAEVIRPRKS